MLGIERNIEIKAAEAAVKKPKMKILSFIAVRPVDLPERRSGVKTFADDDWLSPL